MTSTSSFDPASAVVPTVAPKLPVTVDSQGRLRTSKEQRRAILNEFESSGVSAARFAKRAGLKYSTFAGWVQRYRRTRPVRRAKPLRLLEAVLESAQTSSTDTSLLLQLPGGVQLEVTNEKQAALAAMLVRALKQPC